MWNEQTERCVWMYDENIGTRNYGVWIRKWNISSHASIECDYMDYSSCLIWGPTDVLRGMIARGNRNLHYLEYILLQYHVDFVCRLDCSFDDNNRTISKVVWFPTEFCNIGWPSKLSEVSKIFWCSLSRRSCERKIQNYCKWVYETRFNIKPMWITEISRNEPYSVEAVSLHLIIFLHEFMYIFQKCSLRAGLETQS